MSLQSFALFVSCVEGSLVTRYGTGTFIGAERRADDPRQVDFHPDQVIAIPDDEFRKYRREYLRALREGSLRQRTEAEWQRQNATPEPTELGTDTDTTAAAEAPAGARLKRPGDTSHDDPARRRTGD